MVQVTIYITLILLKFKHCVVFLVIIQKLWLSFSTTMQYVIYTYMKHLGVRVKEPRSLESKRVRINFLPKIKVFYAHLCAVGLLSFSFSLPETLSSLFLNKIQKSIKTEKEGEEKVKKPRFPSILGPQRRPSRIEAGPGEYRLLN